MRCYSRYFQLSSKGIQNNPHPNFANTPNLLLSTLSPPPSHIQLQPHWPCVCVHAQSHPTLCNPTDGSPPGSSVMGFSRQEYWSGLPRPSPGDLPDPGIEAASPTRAGAFFTTEPPGKPLALCTDPQLCLALCLDHSSPIFAWLVPSFFRSLLKCHLLREVTSGHPH